MILRCRHLSLHPSVFSAMTCLDVAKFDARVSDVLPHYDASKWAWWEPPCRLQIVGGERKFSPACHNHLLLTVSSIPGNRGRSYRPSRPCTDTV